MAILKKRTSEQEWLRKYCEDIQVIHKQRPQYNPNWMDDSFNRNYVSYTVDTEETYNVTLSKHTVEYLAQIEDAMFDTRDNHYSYSNPYGENRAESWIKQQLAEENREVALRKKYPTLQEAWDQYQFIKKMLGH